VIEVQSDADKRDFTLPESMQIQWLVNPHPQLGNSVLSEAVMQLTWLTGIPNVWIAGESSSVRSLRSYLAKEKVLDRQHRYTSGYWQIGQDEDAFQLVKRQESD